MRIIPDGIKSVDKERYLRQPAYLKSDTIEITDDEWDKILLIHLAKHTSVLLSTLVETKPFSQYLRELIELRRVM